MALIFCNMNNVLSTTTVAWSYHHSLNASCIRRLKLNFTCLWLLWFLIIIRVLEGATHHASANDLMTLYHLNHFYTILQSYTILYLNSRPTYQSQATMEWNGIKFACIFRFCIFSEYSWDCDVASGEENCHNIQNIQAQKLHLHLCTRESPDLPTSRWQIATLGPRPKLIETWHTCGKSGCIKYILHWQMRTWRGLVYHYTQEINYDIYTCLDIVISGSARSPKWILPVQRPALDPVETLQLKLRQHTPCPYGNGSRNLRESNQLGILDRRLLCGAKKPLGKWTSREVMDSFVTMGVTSRERPNMYSSATLRSHGSDGKSKISPRCMVDPAVSTSEFQILITDWV